MKVGDLVAVNMRLDGPKRGIILKPWGHGLGNTAWIVALCDHRTANTIASECDMEVISEGR